LLWRLLPTYFQSEFAPRGGRKAKASDQAEALSGAESISARFCYSSRPRIISPPANLLKASNEAQELGMKATDFVFVFLGAWLIVSGVKPGFKSWSPDKESSEIAR
jgi:hypothetical protein